MENAESNPQFDKVAEPTIVQPEREQVSNEEKTLKQFNEMFPIDTKKFDDKAAIENLMDRVKNTGPEGSFALFSGTEWQYNQFRKSRRDREYRYTREQINKKQWSEEDYQSVVLEIQKERCTDYFHKISRKYEWGGTTQKEFNIRQEEQKEIYEDIQDNHEVVVRSIWTVGKSSLLRSVAERYFGKSPDNYCDIDLVNIKTLDQIQNSLNSAIARAITYRYSDKSDLDQREFDVGNKKGPEEKPETESFESNLQLLNELLKINNEKFLIILDEIFTSSDEVLDYVSKFRNLSNVKFAIVLHKIGFKEHELKAKFKDFKTHWVRPLSLEDTKQLIQKPLEGTRVQFSNEAIEKYIKFLAVDLLRSTQFAKHYWRLILKTGIINLIMS